MHIDEISNFKGTVIVKITARFKSYLEQHTEILKIYLQVNLKNEY